MKRRLKTFLSRGLLLGILWMGLGISPLMANEFSTVIKEARLRPYSIWYSLVVESRYNLSSMAIEALQSGIPLRWCLQVNIESLGHIWHEVLFNQSFCYKVQYHALVKTYSVTQKETHYFHSLTAALSELLSIQKVNLIKRSNFQATKRYRLVVKWDFDREALPAALRVLSYFYSHWDLSSKVYVWTLKP